MTIEKVSDIVPQKSKGVVVEASPLNQIKFELGVLMVVAVLFLLVVPTFVVDLDRQLMIFAGYGLLAAGWLILRIRSVLAKHAEQGSGETHQE